MERAFAHVDGWNFYHGINTPDLHAFGFVDLWDLCARILGPTVDLQRVRYFTADDYHPGLLERQRFWLQALESAGVTIEERGFFGRAVGETGRREKTTDVRLALSMVEDATTRGTEFEAVLLFAADADYLPALEKLRALGKRVRIAFPPHLYCKELRAYDPRPKALKASDLKRSLFNGERCTNTGVSLAKALDYGWACKVNGVVTRGHEAAESEHWRRWPHLKRDA